MQPKTIPFDTDNSPKTIPFGQSQGGGFNFATGTDMPAESTTPAVDMSGVKAPDNSFVANLKARGNEFINNDKTSVDTFATNKGQQGALGTLFPVTSEDMAPNNIAGGFKIP